MYVCVYVSIYIYIYICIHIYTIIIVHTGLKVYSEKPVHHTPAGDKYI